MKLLIITQAIDLDDPILGFFHEWVCQFAGNIESVHVIAQRIGRMNLPSNVTVYAIRRLPTDSKLLRLWRMVTYIYKVIGRVDKIFVHMAPIFAIIIWPFARIYRKPLALWYVHKTVDLKLRIAEKMVDVVFSASSESFRLPSKKLEIVGHGVDTELFRPGPVPHGPPIFLAVGRLARSKRLDFFIDALASISKSLPEGWRLLIIGNPMMPDDRIFLIELKKQIMNLELEENVELKGGVQHREMAQYYQNAHLFLHASATGSVDKTVLEAMSTNLPVVSSSEAFYAILPEEYIVRHESIQVFGEKIMATLSRGRDERLRKIIEERFQLKRLIQAVTEVLEQL